MRSGELVSRLYRLMQTELCTTEPFELLDVRCRLLWGRAPYPMSSLSRMPYADGRVGIHIRVGGPPSPEGV
jgi:hypothetical protein